MRATHGPSGETLATDAPVDNQGRGETFSPTDLVATALGACMATIMGIVAERHGLDISGMTVSVEKGMVVEPARRIGALPVTITFARPVPETFRSRLEEAAHTCPVHASLHPDIDAAVTFVYPEEGCAS